MKGADNYHFSQYPWQTLACLQRLSLFKQQNSLQPIEYFLRGKPIRKSSKSIYEKC